MKYTLVLCALFLFSNQPVHGAANLTVSSCLSGNILKRSEKKIISKKTKKQLKPYLKAVFNKSKDEGEKKKLPFGIIALICLAAVPLGVLIGSGIGNFLIFLGWFSSLIFGLRGMKKDENKFPALIALAIALALLISTFTFLDLVSF